MPVFAVTGDVDPFLHVALDKGEAIFCESDAMVMMEANLDLAGAVQGGIFKPPCVVLPMASRFFSNVSKPRVGRVIACCRPRCRVA